MTQFSSSHNHSLKIETPTSGSQNDITQHSYTGGHVDTDAASVWAIVLVFIGFFFPVFPALAAICCGIAALRRIKGHPDNAESTKTKGHNIAIIAIIVGAMQLFAAFIASIVLLALI